MNEIVVGIDGSPQAVEALRWAAQEAGRRHSRVRAIAVFDYAVVDVLGANVQLHPFSGDPARAFEHVVAAIDAVRPDAGDVTIEPEAAEGDPGRVLCDAADDADLMVVGRHGTTLRPHRLGSVASYVTHHSRCPVVIVPSTSR